MISLCSCRIYPGFLTLYLYFSHGSPQPVVVTLTMALAAIVPADILRLNSPRFEKEYERYLGFLMRESEKVSYFCYALSKRPTHYTSPQKTTNGVIWYIVGVIWVLVLYPLDIAVVSILMCVCIHPCFCYCGLILFLFQPLLGRHCCFHYRSPVGSLYSSFTETLPRPAFCTSQVTCRVHRWVCDWCGYCCWILGTVRAFRERGPNLDLGRWCSGNVCRHRSRENGCSYWLAGAGYNQYCEWGCEWGCRSSRLVFMQIHFGGNILTKVFQTLDHSTIT
jgi:hypothetical protein